ncbi:MAG: hypothetical protein JHC26_08565 [Thermofilum sp.]|uniref:hypothetical protein n=1 Tax=Thermofilum sp. TaxID=1961369 RepID=UPI00258F1134|nr:hypothetical protein [Thermofilum sp.]MCI4409129.1 hypothetical protein [Thermofilum sp.]
MSVTKIRELVKNITDKLLKNELLSSLIFDAIIVSYRVLIVVVLNSTVGALVGHSFHDDIETFMKIIHKVTEVIGNKLLNSI